MRLRRRVVSALRPALASHYYSSSGFQQGRNFADLLHVSGFSRPRALVRGKICINAHSETVPFQMRFPFRVKGVNIDLWRSGRAFKPYGSEMFYEPYDFRRIDSACHNKLTAMCAYLFPSMAA